MRLARDVAGLIGGKESRERGDLLGMSEPTHRLAFDESLFDLRERFTGRARTILDPLLERRRFDRAGTDGVGSDAFLDEIGGHRFGKSNYGRFCGAVLIANRDSAATRK